MKPELRPQPGPQTGFLSSSADIAIFGGAAGGGKSFSLLLEPCYHIGNGKFRCVIFRRTVPMLHAYSPSKVIHRWRGGSFISPPQPAVNNFGGGAKMSGAKLSLLLNPWVEHAGAGRRIPRSNAPTFPRRLSLRHPAPGRQGTLRTFRLQVQTGQRRTSISDSIRPGPRARQN